MASPSSKSGRRGSAFSGGGSSSSDFTSRRVSGRKSMSRFTGPSKSTGKYSYSKKSFIKKLNVEKTYFSLGSKEFKNQHD